MIGTIDLLHWFTSLPDGAVQQMLRPMQGVKVSSAASGLFGLDKDDAGLMLISSAKEAPWLESQPFVRAFVGFDDQLILITTELNLFDTPINETAVGLCVPDVSQRARLASATQLGFGLVDVRGAVRRVGTIIPVFTPDRFTHEAYTAAKKTNRALFRPISKLEESWQRAIEESEKANRQK